MTVSPESIVAAFQKVQATAPLVHNLTNFVVMNFTANVLLALGASPIMAHAPEELEEIVNMSSSSVINIGTLNREWIASMELAIASANEQNKPIVIDPVGVGATKFRTETAKRLLEQSRRWIVRGNASEILALSGERGATKGVDSTEASDRACDAARSIVQNSDGVVIVSGAVDYVLSPTREGRIRNGHPIMTRITGMGCAGSGVVGAFAGALENDFEAACSGAAIMAIAGEIAAQRQLGRPGTGSFQVDFLDALSRLEPEQIRSTIKFLEV